MAVYAPNPAYTASVGSPIARLANMTVPDFVEFRNITWPIDLVVASMASLFVGSIDLIDMFCLAFLSSSCWEFWNELPLKNEYDDQL